MLKIETKNHKCKINFMCVNKCVFLFFYNLLPRDLYYYTDNDLFITVYLSVI